LPFRSSFCREIDDASTVGALNAAPAAEPFTFTWTVTKTQGNGFWFDFEGKRCWSPYPKADEITFTSERVFTVTPSDSKSWTLEIVA